MPSQKKSRRHIVLAEASDLGEIVRIYNTSIASRMATAHTEPVSVESRRLWFNEHEPTSRPLWILREDAKILGWLGVQSFYGRPAYRHTVEVSVYVDPLHLKQRVASELLSHLIHQAPLLGVKTLLAFVFAHNEPSLDLFKKMGFVPWGELPAVALLDESWVDLTILGRKIL